MPAYNEPHTCVLPASPGPRSAPTVGSLPRHELIRQNLRAGLRVPGVASDLLPRSTKGALLLIKRRKKAEFVCAGTASWTMLEFSTEGGLECLERERRK